MFFYGIYPTLFHCLSLVCFERFWVQDEQKTVFLFAIICLQGCQANLSAFISCYSLQLVCGITAYSTWIYIYTHTSMNNTNNVLNASSPHHSLLSFFLFISHTSSISGDVVPPLEISQQLLGGLP